VRTNVSKNVLAATYPDIFKAGIVYSGVGAGCFVSTSGGIAAWNSTCANGQATATPQAWANVVFNMYPGYNGTRPRMQVYHGSTDGTLRPQNYQETMKQWVSIRHLVMDPSREERQLTFGRLVFSVTTIASLKAPRAMIRREDIRELSMGRVFKESTLRVLAIRLPFEVRMT
jgi:hypothetical protein